jgi:hypothetical protein
VLHNVLVFHRHHVFQVQQLHQEQQYLELVVVHVNRILVSMEIVYQEQMEIRNVNARMVLLELDVI